MSIRLDGRVAIVTGSGGGLGREHALLLGRLGAKVVVNDLGVAVDGTGGTGAAADRVVAEIRALGGEAVANCDSVSDPASAQRIVDAALHAFGRVDLLINNAGILRDRSFGKMTAEDFEEVVRVHLLGTFYVTKAAWPLMVQQKYGRIVFTTSTAATNGNFGQANYSAAKLGVVGMMNSLALEGPKNNVLVNAIAPGAMTRMTEGVEQGPLTEYLRADLVSPAVAWLCSARCREAGMIIAAMGGFYARIHYFEGAGVQFDPTFPVTVDAFDEAFGRIGDLSEARPVRPGALGDLEARLKAMGRL
ncbi:MAG: SDR family NAD(P)-dependent oxidoreductase [Deltaproteobacteria bacterium]|nr:SDR family NAD(P)-dependent oxidoreductase [Deltaproteobacteria bacterium]